MADERARLFVALRLPEGVREELSAWRTEALRGVPGLRLIAPEYLHVTLCFLGWRSVSEIDEIAVACEVVTGCPAAALRVGEAIWLPRRRPRVLAVALEDLTDAIGHVQSTLSDALAAGGWYEPESRPFLAHVTVARVAKDARVRARPLPAPSALPVRGSQVTLYRSRLGAGGARYEPLTTVELGST